jgi:4-amino-4-deoxy-L-arabinose transferase-like glycosyltransferase
MKNACLIVRCGKRRVKQNCDFRFSIANFRFGGPRAGASIRQLEFENKWHGRISAANICGQTRYIPQVRELVRQHLRFFVLAALAALALRLLFILWFPAISDDSRIYADIAKNWLQHGIYGVTDHGRVVPTLARLPGYPAFLALIFAIFGLDNFRAVLLVQIIVDIGTCWMMADMALRLISERAAKIAFLLAAVCPFLANYSAAVLTETFEIFFTALALDFAIAGLQGLEQRRLRPWAGCGAAVAAAILLRPDGGMLVIAIGAYLAYLWLQRLRARRPSGQVLRAGLLVAAISLAPVVPWTLRNLHALHKFQPLAPRYANEEEEAVSPGFNRWVRTWMADYVSVQEIYWNVPGVAIDGNNLPARAFDSSEQRQRTLDLLARYNQAQEMTPELDAQFAELAKERIRSRPFRYYVWLPAVRIVDMWLRPRTELLQSDPRWWEFNDDPRWSAVAVGFGIINLVYVAAAVIGLLKRPAMAWTGLFVVFVVLRSLFLGTLENPEPRYTLECYPVAILFASKIFT